MIITFDVETTGLHHKKDSLLSLSYLYGKCDGDATYPFETYYTEKDMYGTFDLMVDMFPSAIYVAHNIKFDLRFLDVDPNTVDKLNIIDTTILYHYLFPRNEKKLGSIEKHLIGTEQKNTYLERFGKDFSLWPKEKLERYNKLDVEITYRIYKKLIDHVDQNFLEYQTNYLKALYRIEYYGIGFDQTMATVEETTTTVLAETKEKGLRTWINDNYGYDVSKLNFNSSKQLSNLLYVDLDIPKPDRNDFPTGKAFDKLFTTTLTNADLLETMKHPFVNLFLEWKKVIAVSKSIQTYAELAHENRIFPSFNITGTITGRISCSSPNLQNSPKDKKGLPSVRSLFRPDKDQTLVSIDYQQQEIRMLAILSGDENLLSLVKQGVDMHTVVGKQMFRKEEISKSERDIIKSIHFGMIYGLSLSAIAFKIGSDIEYADWLVRSYYENFPQVQEFMDNTKEECRTMGGLTLFTGRNWESLPSMEYQAVNAIIQGSCAELTALSVIRVSKYLKKSGYGRIMSIIHDEILFSLNDTGCIPEIVQRMQMTDLFNIPFLVDVDYTY